MLKPRDRDLLVDVLEMNEEKLTPKQAKIVQAAIEVFSEKGFAGASTSEIAKRAGVAEGTIFRHYKTKKDLLISIVLPVISKLALPFLADQFVKEVLEEEEYEDVDQFLRELIYNRYHFVKKNLPLMKIVLQEMFYHSEIKENLSEILTDKLLPAFSQAIQRFLTEEQQEKVPVETILRLSISSVVGFLITRFMIAPDFDWDDDQEIEYTIQFIRNGLRGLS
ncbi:TetR/AcrR family transcriptional regulator [Gracilibacillus caseinilyticus]|uniref:TetR/AcrR family transcriptional regulator n=1 Tax=Gracilibacillus caseinilyticus TaxID=2932256 RepID=A0ABY4EWW9_9BACI|nr:TetR/AcrR family transcriptional regulator [Gracilibacillus caseinilyticus]UOQ48909.1 TetR/AcrR family transcriptional regulator [Gracilibacillus caseinilyticus]